MGAGAGADSVTEIKNGKQTGQADGIQEEAGGGAQGVPGEVQGQPDYNTDVLLLLSFTISMKESLHRKVIWVSTRIGITVEPRI